MKKILKSLLVLAAVSVTMAGATRAWFTSTVTAKDNEISTGTLMLAVDSTRTHSYSPNWTLYDAYTVVRDLDGESDQRETLEAWTNAEPASYVAYEDYVASGEDPDEPGNNSVWMTVRNRGSLPAKAYLNMTGEWTDLPRIGSASCTSVADEASANHNLVRARKVHIYGGGSSACENHEECRNLRDALEGLGSWSNIPATYSTVDVDYNTGLGGTGATFYLSTDTTADGDAIYLQPNEFVVVRVDLNLSTSADNCYQNGTYLYDVTLNGSQEANLSW